MRLLFTFLRTIFTYIVLSIAVPAAFIPCFFIACLPARWRYDNRIYYWINYLVYKVVIFATFLSIKTRGKENMPKEPAIFVANHASSLDVPVLGSILDGAPHVWLFYVRYAKIPVVGWMLRRMNVVIDPSGLRKLVGSLDKTIEIVKNRTSHVMIFPEGGRFADGAIHPFFYGFAVIAKGTGRPVVPVIMHNLGKIYAPNAFFIRFYPIEVLVGKPFVFGQDETDEQFVKRVHAWFVEQASSSKEED